MWRLARGLYPGRIPPLQRSRPGSGRAYSEALLGLDLGEIAAFLLHEDRLAEIRAVYHDASTSTSTARRRELVKESLIWHAELRVAVEAKRVALDTFLADLDERIARVRDAMTLLRPAESYGARR